MSRFIIDNSYWELFPESTIGVLLLKSYKNSDESPKELVDLLKESNQIAQKYLTTDNFSDNEVIQVYRQAFQKFKTKKGARSSIEALLKRSSGDNAVGTINPLVDIYNAASLRYALPCGAEDLDTFVGDLRLTITEGGDEFYLINDDKNSPTLPNELCYKDDAGAVCRCFNWRDGQRTMVTDQTTNAFLVMELLEEDRLADLQDALTFITEYAQKYLEADVTQFLLTKDNTQIDL